MNKNFKIFGIFFIIIVIIMGLVEINKKEKIDWNKNFDVNKKSPFGLFVFNKEIKSLFKGKLTKIDQNAYEFYSKNSKKSPHNILAIETDLDKESYKKILEEVSKGSDAMLIMTYTPRDFEDTIGISTAQKVYAEMSVLKLTDAKFQNDYLQLNKFPSGRGVSYIKPEWKILGKSIQKGEIDHANFVSRKFGKGTIFIHTEPLFLTNYYLLKPGNTRYAQQVFSYLPDRETLWFVDSNTEESGSLMRFILSKPALKYAWWLLLSGIVVFVLFNAKRKQRIVPIIEPLQNNSVDFVRSIGNLYLQEGDFHDMMAKKAQYFLNRVRMDLLIDTQNLDEEFAKKLQLKTGKPAELIEEAVVLIKKAQDPYATVINEDLPRLNSLLDKILK